MRQRVRRWAKHKSLSALGRVVIANTVVTSVAGFMAAFTTPTDEQLREMDYLVWAAVWGTEVGESGVGAKRGGWLGLEAAQLSREEGGLGLLLPSVMIRSRQLAMLNRALLNKRSIWTLFLQQYLKEWGGKWTRGWDTVMVPPPKEAGKLTQWAGVVREWQKLKWHADPPRSAYEVRAAPLWVHPGLPALSTARREKQAGARSLAAAGVLRVDDVWDAGRCEWKLTTEVQDAIPARAWAGAQAMLSRVRSAVDGWLGRRESLLWDPPARPRLRSWWWDSASEKGGQVVGVQDCDHCDASFMGFDVVIDYQSRDDWVAESERGDAVRPANRPRTVCGFDGGPVGLHPAAKRRSRQSLTDLVTEEGVNPSTWWTGEEEAAPCRMHGPARAMRRAMRAASTKEPPIRRPLEQWSRWGGVEGAQVQRHFVAASRFVGIPHKARQIILRLLWKKVLFKGPGATRTCPLCGMERVGEGEEHMFMTCPLAKEVWERAEGLLQAGGVVINTRHRASLCGQPMPPIRSPPGVKGGVVWRLVWAGVIWGLWKAQCEANHGYESGVAGVEIAWRAALRVWRDHLRVRNGQLTWRSSAREDLVRECNLVWSKEPKVVRIVRGRGGKQKTKLSPTKKEFITPSSK
jgi:hypothetical protein